MGWYWLSRVGRVSGGCCECEHEVRDCTCPGVQYPKSAGIEAELCNEEGVLGEGGDSDGVGDESGNYVVGCCHRPWYIGGKVSR